MHTLLIAACLFLSSSVFAAPAVPFGPCNSEERTTTSWEDAQKTFGYFAGKFRVPPSGAANEVFSPLSLQLAVAQLIPGARGETLQQLAEPLLGTREYKPEMLRVFRDTLRSLICRNEYESSVIRVANRLFVQTGKELVPAYLSTLDKEFFTTVGRLDYRQSPGSAVKEINHWVNESTAGKIDQLVDESIITKDTRLVIANALYLKGAWHAKFDPAATKPEPFHLAKGKTIKVPMMHVETKMDSAKYADFPDFQVVDLPLADEVASLRIILPKKERDPRELLQSLGEDKLVEIRNKLEHWMVKLSLPKFKVRSKFIATKAFQAMGVKRAFAPNAELEGIDEGREKLNISTIIHEALLDVNEEGMEGAAATAAVGRAGGGPPQPRKVTLKIDRPFVFYVVEGMAGGTVFRGWVGNPGSTTKVSE